MSEQLLKYFDGDELASKAWSDKYQYKEAGEKTPTDMHLRMTSKFHQSDKRYQDSDRKFKHKLSEYGKVRKKLTEKRIFGLFNRFNYIIPQGSVMSQLGNENSYGSLSNCVVVDSPEDSYAGIMEVDTKLAQLMKRRCGVGFDMSTLRPKTAKVTNSAKTSTGAVSFMNRFSETTREVAQGGRRGALMLTMDINHPDILDFIQSKRDLTKITGANISIKVNDEFMNAVVNDEDYILRFPCDIDVHEGYEPDEYNVLKQIPNEKIYVKKVKAKDIYDEFVTSNWLGAEPAFLYWDRVQQYSPDSAYLKYLQKSTNPCSEIAMQPNDTCRLMVLNLTSFVVAPYTKRASFDYGMFEALAYEQQRLADDLIDLEILKINRILSKLKKEDNPINDKEIELWTNLRETAKNGRRTGCGFTGLGDTLAMLGHDYDSDVAMRVTDRIMKTKMQGELNATIDMAIQRGAFKEWDKEKEYPKGKPVNEFYAYIKDEFPKEWERMMKYGRRNISWSTVAPTGTVSIMAQTTSGIEPVFMTHYMRRKKVNPTEENRIDFVDENGDSWTEYPVVHKGLTDWWKAIHFKQEVVPPISELSEEHFAEVMENNPYSNSSAGVIDWRKRIELQSVVQKHTTHSISSTINLPKDATEQEIADIYLEAWKRGLKGITVYRDGSRSGVLVSDTETNEEFYHMDAVKRPKTIDMDLFHVTAQGKRFTIIIGLVEGKPYELFALHGEIGKHHTQGTVTKVRGGGYNIEQNGVVTEDITNNMTSAEIAMTRMVSMALRHRVHVKYIVEQLNKSEEFIVSFTKAIARTLKKYIEEGEKATVKCENPDCTGDRTNVVFEEGCHKCMDCGSTACG